MTNIQHRVDDNIDTVLLCDPDCVFQLTFGPPASRDSALLVKLAKVPLRAVRTWAARQYLSTYKVISVITLPSLEYK